MFLKLAQSLRTIRSAIYSKNYRAAITALIDLMATMDLADEAAKARNIVDGITTSDYREITVNSLSLVSEGLAMIFGFPPVQFSGFAAGNPEAALCHNLDYFAQCADAADHGAEKVAAMAPNPDAATALNPAVVRGIVSLITSLVTEWLNRKTAHL